MMSRHRDRRYTVQVDPRKAADRLEAVENALAEANAGRPDPGLLVEGEPMTPLRELSLLLGVEIADVVLRHASMLRMGDGRRHHHEVVPQWQLVLVSGARTPSILRSRWLRQPDYLTQCAVACGRDPALPPLTKDESRRALRLMHEHVESKNPKNINTNAEEDPK